MIEVAEEQGIGDEAGLVADDDRLLAECRGERGYPLDDLIGRDDGAHDLDEGLDGSGVEEVEADDLSGSRRGDRDICHRERRRVRREDGVGGDDGIERSEQLPLELEALWHRLDHEVDACEVGEFSREDEAPEEGSLLVLGHLAALDGSCGGCGHPLLCPGERLGRHLNRHDAEAAAGDDLGNAASHRAESDDAHLLHGSHCPCHGRSLPPPAPGRCQAPAARRVGGSDRRCP